MAYHVHQAADELAAEDFRVKKPMFMGGSKEMGPIIYSCLGVHAVHTPTKFREGRTL